MTTDLTFNVAYLGEQGKSFLKLADAVDTVTDRLERLDHQITNPKVTVDTSSADKSLDELKAKVGALDNLNIGQGSAIAGGLALGAGALTAGGLLAIPAAIAAIGIAAEKADPEVAQAFGSMTTAAKQAAQEGLSPLVPAFVGLADSAKTSLGTVKTELAEGATAAAPLVTIIGNDMLKAGQQGLGGIVPIISELRPAAQALGDDIIKVEQGAVGFLGNLNADTASQGLETLGTDVGNLLPQIGSLVSEVIPLGNSLLSVLGPALTNVTSAASGLAPVVNAASSSISFLGPDISAYAVPALAAVGVTKLLTGSWTDFSGAAGRVKPIVTDTGTAVTALGQRVGFTSAAVNAGAKVDLDATLVRARLAAQTAETTALEAAFAAEEAGTAEAELAAVVAADALASSEAELAAATEAAAAASTAASFSFGPLGIALGAIALLALPFITSTSKAGESTKDLTSDLVRLSQAAPGATAGIVSGNQPLADLINQAGNAGISVSGLIAAYSKGPEALAEFSDSLRQQHDTLGDTQISTGKFQGSLQDVAVATRNLKGEFDQLPPSVQKLVTEYNNQGIVLGQLGTSTAELTKEQQAQDAITSQSASSQQQAAGIAQALGISVSQAASAYAELASGQTFAMTSTQQASDTILGQALALRTANTTAQDYFATADAGVKAAQASLADASRSSAQAAVAVGDAQHSEAQAAQAVVTAQVGVVTAQRGVKDALDGVTTAEQGVTKARAAAQQVQLGLTAAEAAATEQLKQLHLQLTAQVTSEQSARVALFDAQTSAGVLGVTAANAQSVAGQKVTASNEDRIKAAIALLQAEESLNSTLDTGTNLRNQVSAADKAGVAGSQQVIAAQQAIASAQAQVLSSEQALTKAHQAVTDAQANVLKAEQGVTDALYNEQKAQQAVTDALGNRAKAAQAVTTAQQALTTAQDVDSHSKDISTAAGARNLAMLKQIADQLATNESPTAAANDLIKDTATLFGTSTTNAKKLLTQLGLLTAKPFKFSVVALGDVDLSRLPKLSGTGGHLTFASGGPVFGAGGPRDDKIPAMLSNREYVEPAASVDYYGLPFMEAIRQKRLPKFLADGGLAAQNVLYGAAGIEYQDASELFALMGKPGTLPSIAAYVAPAFLSGTGGACDAGAHSASAQVAQAYAASQLAHYGWGAGQMVPLTELWNQESGWDDLIVNKSSGAYGIPQALPGDKMASAGPDWRTNYKTQINWGLGYIDDRYETPAGAWAHEVSDNWYRDGGLAVKPPKSLDTGGWLDQGLSLVHNGTGDKERVRTGAQEDALLAELQKLNASISALPHLTVNGAPQHSVDQLVSEVMRRLTFTGRG